MKSFFRTQPSASIICCAVSLVLLGTQTTPAEIVVQVYPEIHYLPTDQIRSESGLGMTRWQQAVQQLPATRSPSAFPGQRPTSLPRRQLKIAYVYVAVPSPSHTAGQGSNAQTGAITSESQADATRHELWHIEVARAAAIKANELETRLISMLPSRNLQSDAQSQTEILTRIEQTVARRYHALRDKYNAKLHTISSACVIHGVWRDNPSDELGPAVGALLAQLRSEPIEEEEPKIAHASPGI
ncbi:MAG: hypothetical protein DVB23_001959 [Verrucomicrobia bacterium]|nr:MAG: hypothetical protein DVB23_001959 [Verrucomicrobiota bacterium]